MNIYNYLNYNDLQCVGLWVAMVFFRVIIYNNIEIF